MERNQNQELILFAKECYDIGIIINGLSPNDGDPKMETDYWRFVNFLTGMFDFRISHDGNQMTFSVDQSLLETPEGRKGVRKSMFDALYGRNKHDTKFDYALIWG